MKLYRKRKRTWKHYNIRLRQNKSKPHQNNHILQLIAVGCGSWYNHIYIYLYDIIIYVCV